MDAPTDRQLEVLLWIIGFRQRHGMPPSIREMMDGFGVRSTNAVDCHLRALKRKGLIEWEPKQSRTLRPTVKFIPAEGLAT